LLEEPAPPFELLYEAWFVTEGQVANVVGDVMWTVVVPPDAIVVDGHVSVPDAMAQAADHPVWPAIVQLSPEFVGSVSLSVTPVALAGPAFETVIV